MNRRHTTRRKKSLELVYSSTKIMPVDKTLAPRVGQTRSYRFRPAYGRKLVQYGILVSFPVKSARGT